MTKTVKSTTPKAEQAEVVLPKVNKAGNIPWRRKFYTPNGKGIGKAQADGSFLKLPGQCQGIIRYMMSEHFNEQEQGKTIVEKALEFKFVVSKIEPAVLFAYYRKRLEDEGFITLV